MTSFPARSSRSKPIAGTWICAGFLSLVVCARSLAQDAVVPDDFPSLAAAIAQATDVNGSGRVEIRVRAGRYSENLVISRSDLTIEGEDLSTTIVSGDGIADAIRIDGAVSVTLRNLTIGAAFPGADGIEMNRASGARVEDCVVAGHFRGVTVVRSPGCVIAHCSVTGNRGVGIKIARDSAGVLVHSNTVSRNGNHGIDSLHSDNVSVLDNDVQANGGNGLRIGLCSFCQVNGNRFESNDESGILTGRATEIVFLSNTSTNNENGIRLEETHVYTISGNDFSRNDEYGIRRRLWDRDDYDAGAPGVQPPAGANDVSGNGEGGVRSDS